MYKRRYLGVAHAIECAFREFQICFTPDDKQRNAISSYTIVAVLLYRTNSPPLPAAFVTAYTANAMAPTASNNTTSLPVSATPEKGSWSPQCLTFLHQIYTEFVFADLKKRSQHVIAIFQKIFEFDLLITHPNELEDRHIPDKYLAWNKAGRKGRFKEVEAEPKSPEQQARVNKIMPLIRSAIVDLGFQGAISETQIPVAEDDEDVEDGEDGENGEDGEGVDEAVEEAGEQVVNGESQQAGSNDEDVEEQSRAPQRKTKRKQIPDHSQNEPSSKKSRISRPAAAAAVEKAEEEEAEGAEDGIGEQGKPQTNDGGGSLVAIRSSNRRTTHSSRLQEAIADGGSGIIGTQTNAAAAVASSNVSNTPSSQLQQTSRRKASRATSSWNGPANLHKKGKRISAQDLGTEEHPLIVEDEKSALELMSADKTPMLLKHLQKAKLNSSLGNSSNAAGLSNLLYKINNPLATPIEQVSDWQETQRRMFNWWADEEGASTARTPGGNGGSGLQGREGRRGKLSSATMLGDDHASGVSSQSKASDALVNTTHPQPAETMQRASTNPFGFRPMPNYSRYPDLMAEASMISRPRPGLDFLGSGVDAGTARQHEGDERLRLVATDAQLPPLVQDQHTLTPAPGAVSSNRRSLFDAIHSRRDSAIGLPGTSHTSSSPAGSYASFASQSLQTSPTSSKYTSGLPRRPEPLLLRQFYGPKPRTADTASSVGRTGRSVQIGSEAASAEEDELATITDSSKKNDSV
ncbi:hypothetical protein LTS10_012034 [Elasticomyces elasticus]|nr:hypothetical protein LTS10_012034 [Elasticomyces elasticus]